MLLHRKKMYHQRWQVYTDKSVVFEGTFLSTSDIIVHTVNPGVIFDCACGMNLT